MCITPDEYRAKWGLKVDYPMVAPNYVPNDLSWRSRAGSAESRQRATGKKRSAR
ncbi:MucR family transcriptional regulator [Mesorhizobium sangaii]|uniref:MucR family transcriptional regulator n=1 Tax=Mesorhizobium sangaii TaxID=505389 RepID=UPI001FE6A720|nr:MucR family transcriptional regulator [Mesorhizobium sangaii]